MLQRTGLFLWSGFTDSLGIYWTLLKIIVPVLIAVRIGIGFDLHIELAQLMAPVMSVVGLPSEVSLVLVVTLFAGLYGGAAVFVSMLASLDMTVAQATVLTAMMVAAHALPIEQQIAQRAGVRIILATLIRFVSALVLGWVLYLLYSSLNVLQHPLTIAWAPDSQIDAPWGLWLQNAALSLFYIFWIILFLIYTLRLCDATGATRIITRALSPFLALMGISKEATSITMTGVLLGMTFGGGLIVREAKSGALGHRTVFLSLLFMSLCHGLIEDTLFALILGGHISGVLFARIFMAVIVTMALNHIIRAIPEPLFYRYFFKNPTS